MKKSILSLLLALLPLLAIADPVEINGIYYNLNAITKQAEVTSNPNKYKGDINIPDKVNFESVDYVVTSIGEKAFFECRDMKSVNIPNSVTSIGDYAFYNCAGQTSFGLASVAIPNSVTSIGNHAFWGYSDLTSVYITDIESWCKISFGGSYSNPLSFAHQLYLNGELVSSLMIPNSITSIGDYVFNGCSMISVTIPSSVTSIGDCAFDGCSGLTSMTIPNSVTFIGNFAFFDCRGLTSITTPNSVTSIGKSAFSDCI